ncbi:AraC family transcriptional regulator [Xanthocytophaga flava]|uniref:AraC family transcriptional regulator n=1 Tax=Xanthocytophaga flava TaxID=3048013 RepID=UPI0028D3E802|nr:helix-turn-helix transcriptional regulator [Xanthocytophaga flavus]MDJ1467995.1 helix-turn-helix transcriptional regulator [Xanthocytophaga flavus]
MKPAIPVYDICAIAQKTIDENDLLIERFSVYLQTRKKLWLPHRHSFYHLVMFTKGGGGHTIDFVQFPVVPFQIYFMIPGQVHSWDFEGEMDGYVINFSSEFFQPFLKDPDYLDQFSFFKGNCENSVVSLTESERERIVTLFEHMLEESALEDKGKTDIIRTLLLELFMRVDRIVLSSTPQLSKHHSNYHTLREYQRLIDLHFATLKLPGEYVSFLNVTVDHLNEICKEFLGQSSGQLIRNRILLEAKRLLVNADLSISEIAYQLNFSDNSYFTKFFKKYTQITPESFRKQALIKVV